MALNLRSEFSTEDMQMAKKNPCKYASLYYDVAMRLWA